MANTINKQTPVTPELSDLIAIWQSSNNDTRRTSLSYLLDLFQDNLTFPDAGRPEANTQYNSPSTEGFNVQVNFGDAYPDNEDTFLILTPSVAYSLGGITLPAYTTIRDKQQLRVTTSQSVADFVIFYEVGIVNVTGGARYPSDVLLPQTGISFPLGAEDSFIYQYDAQNKTWYHLGST